MQARLDYFRLVLRNGPDVHVWCTAAYVDRLRLLYWNVIEEVLMGEPDFGREARILAESQISPK